MREVLDEKVVRRSGVIDDEVECVHQAAVGKGDQRAEEPGLFLVAENAVNSVVVLKVAALTAQEHRQAFMRQAACPDPPADPRPDDEVAHEPIP